MNAYEGIHSFMKARLMAKTPTADKEVVNKKYVDDKVSGLLKSFTGYDATAIQDLINDHGTFKWVAPMLSSIAITTAPTKVTYTAGDTFDATGMIVTATYTNGRTSVVTGYTYSPTTALATTDTSVTITYVEGGVTKTATQVITVSAG